jgi:3-hydroxyisobutyrate dehydrogenase-like beta-hydroxyacid dehydrogenase
VRVVLFGLGEAGSLYAADLVAAGVEVHAYDPAGVATPSGVVRHGTPIEAVAGVDVLMAITAATDAPTALAQALDSIPSAAVYADCSTASSGLKRALAATAAARGSTSSTWRSCLRFPDVESVPRPSRRGPARHDSSSRWFRSA